jgi:sugar phosphate isomerase/epimerase
VSPPNATSSLVACSTVALFPLPMHAIFPALARAGFGGVEVMVTRDPESQDPARLRALAEEHDLPVIAIHAPFLLMTRGVWGTDPIGKIYRAIELAEAVGARLVVVHPPYRWQGPYRRWLDDSLATLSEHTGVLVGMENMFPVRVRGRSLGSFHARQGLEGLGAFPHVVLDTSHAAVASLDPVEAYRRLAERVVHIHLSNNTGRGWDSHLPLDRGVLALDRFLEALRLDRFAGTISLEIDLRRYASDPEALHEVLVQNRELCEAWLGGRGSEQPRATDGVGTGSTERPSEA